MSVELPQDWSMLLKLLDERFERSNEKQDRLQGSVDDLARRLDSRIEDHEKRLQVVETELAARRVVVKDYDQWKTAVDKSLDDHGKWITESTAATGMAGKIGTALWAVIGGGVVSLGGWLITLYAHSH